MKMELSKEIELREKSQTEVVLEMKHSVSQANSSAERLWQMSPGEEPGLGDKEETWTTE